MKIKLPILQVSGVLLALIVALLSKFVIEIPVLVQNIFFIIALILVITGNFRTNSKRKAQRIANQTNMSKEPIE